MAVSRSGRIVLLLMTLGTSAARLRGHTLDAPDTLTREVNGCLRLVRIAATRRERRPAIEKPADCRQSTPV